MKAPPIILHIDDDARILGLLSVVAHQLGAESVRATNLCDAFTLVRLSPPALITIDGQLPDGNGLDAVRALRSDPKTKTIPILMISGSTLPDQARAAGCDDFVAKPFAIADLLARMDTLLGTLSKHPQAGR